MRISISSDMNEGVAPLLEAELRKRGHTVLTHGALRERDDDGWAYCTEAAARDVAEGRADQAVVCCWTGTGASIAANKVPGVRAALCADAYTADGARRWNDANVLALSLRLTSSALLTEILDAWFAGTPSAEDEDRRNIGHLPAIAGPTPAPPVTVAAPSAPRFVLMRQDDNGNRYVVARYTDHASATAAAETFEARGHKQLYWVEPSGATAD
jgi:RpiB/LacA/LacB family sugar-phosphate isomerase